MSLFLLQYLDDTVRILSKHKSKVQGKVRFRLLAVGHNLLICVF